MYDGILSSLSQMPVEEIHEAWFKTEFSNFLATLFTHFTEKPANWPVMLVILNKPASKFEKQAQNW